jgi:2-phosphosulfolactate phosphatase
MEYLLNVYSLPTVVEPEAMAGGTAVVIDILRATTTIAHALEAQAAEVIPCLEVEDALAVAEQMPRDEVVLGGERGGLLIEGFDLGNSPAEYTPFSVGGKTVVFTTTNGTRAMHRCRLANRVFLGAFVNASAVVRRLTGLPQVHLVCAGSAGQVTRDDVLFAGMLVDRLVRQGAIPYRLNVQALVARENWTTSFTLPEAIGAEPLSPERLAAELRKGLAGNKLASLGLEEDILTAAEIDKFQSVPELDLKNMRIRLAE